MKDRLEKYFGRHAQIVLHIGLVIICIGLIVYFMPREKYTSYDFEPNTPWNHEQIISDFDFVVKKSSKVVTEEKDSIRNHFRPYFSYNAQLNSEVFKKLHPGEELKEYAACLDAMYKDGIVSDEDADMIRSRKNREINFTHNGDTITKDASRFVSVSEAYETLLNADTLLTNEMLASMEPEKFIIPNYICDTRLSDKELNRQLAKIETRIGTVIKGQRIINKGDIIDDISFRTLETYFTILNEIESAKSFDSRLNIFLGQVLFIIICMMILVGYLYIYRPDIATSNNKFIFTLLSATIFPVIVGFVVGHGDISVFILPFAMIPMMLCLFIDPNTALITHCTTIMMCSIMVGSPYEFTMLQTVAGISAILSLKELSSRSQMFRCAFITLLTYAVVYMCYELIIESDFSKMKYNMYMYFSVSAALTLFTYPIMFIVEKTFGFVSNVTLIELSNLNSKLLQKMSQEAPGTFQHSMQVGNLAAEAARALGANSLEVRTGALYHDIGKMNNPIYFTENQSGGINPHDALSPEESAKIIIKHVTDGLAIAEHEHLPKKITEFITTHHGTSKAGYFYITYKNVHPDEEIDESLFTYPGTKPATMEQAILMLADCVEAASHSIKEYTEENIDALVEKIVNSKLQDGELSLSPITLNDVETIKAIFKKRLKAIYHTRISYPSEKKGK
ncbi:MAG: HDIG domain-containing protein [Bacteroidaceae bacterium]|nr:HDIG domain-containing protein [Bacteroidaceae bacterium]